MSKLNIQRFETRPVRAFAVQWDGTKKMAKKIVEYLAGHKVVSSWAEVFQSDYKADIVVPQETVRLTVREPGGAKYFELEKGSWLVRKGASDFEVLTQKEFEESYRVPLNEQENN